MNISGFDAGAPSKGCGCNRQRSRGGPKLKAYNNALLDIVEKMRNAELLRRKLRFRRKNFSK
jgi:hypothetical protein